jgi:DnaJ-class molecular chaperone
MTTTALPATFEEAQAAGYQANSLLFAKLGRDCGYFEALRRAEAHPEQSAMYRRLADTNLRIWMQKNGVLPTYAGEDACSRCSGSGYYGPGTIANGVCFHCGGNGVEP